MRTRPLNANDNHQGNYEFKDEFYDDNSSKVPSLTLQGETFTIKELVSKMATGQVPQIYRNGVFTNPDTFDEPDLEHLNALDISQQYELLSSNAKVINDIASELQKPVQTKEPGETDVKQPEEKKPE